MEFFRVPQNERFELAGLDAQCNFCTERNASFTFYFDDPSDEQHCEVGWLDVHWVARKFTTEIVYLRLCLYPDFATLERCNQIREEIYARLGIPAETSFDFQIVTKIDSIDLIDDRYCIATGIVGQLPKDKPLLPGGGQFAGRIKR
jgi:hypothetical protein